MNKAPHYLIGAIAALFLSWYGMVWGPASQQSSLTPHVDGAAVYPRDRAGLAKQGAEIYRANGCYHCHSQQVRQGQVDYYLMLTRTGASGESLLAAMKEQKAIPDENSTARAQIELAIYLRNDDRNATVNTAARNARKKLKNTEDRTVVLSLAALTDQAAKKNAREFLKLTTEEAGQAGRAAIELAGPMSWSMAQSKLESLKDANASAMLQPREPGSKSDQALWADLQRDWGTRRSVARDYLYDSPAMLGSQRIGPDLADIGGRHTDAARHYQHLYHPRSVAKKSVMPPYTFLFNKRAIAEGTPLGPNAVTDAEGKSIEPGYEITPKPAARALVAYLLSLRQPDIVPEAPAPKRMATSSSKENPK